jgi:hypothetical protein
MTAVTSPAPAADWEWTIAPYLWASDISLDVSANDQSLGGELGFGDLLDKLDFAFLGHVEGRRGRGGFFFDLIYMDLGDTQTTVARPPLPGGTEVKSDVKQTMFEVGGFFRPSGGSHGLDLLYGVRVTDFDLDLTITLPGPQGLSGSASSSQSFTDGFAGLRYQAPLGERWSYVLRGDLGAGDSELAWNTSALLGYQVGKRRQNLILFGYRHMEVELKDSSDNLTIRTDVGMSGPIAGFAFRF